MAVKMLTRERVLLNLKYIILRNSPAVRSKRTPLEMGTCLRFIVHFIDGPKFEVNTTGGMIKVLDYISTIE
jgi:hypothetical protein